MSLFSNASAARSAKTTRNGSNSAIDAAPSGWPVGRMGSGSATSITESTPTTAGSGAHWHGCDGEHGVWRQRVAPRVERGKARVGARVDDRDRTGAPHDPALHTLVWREEHRLCGYACTGCRKSEHRPWPLGEEERRLMNLQQVTGALHNQVECHFQRHALRDRRADVIKLIATERRAWCSNHVDLFLPVVLACVPDSIRHDIAG